MFSYKEDFETVFKRFDAFWERDILDRPLTSITFQKENQVGIKEKEYASEEERWLDFEYRTVQHINNLDNTIFFADSLPVVFPNMGPEIFSAWCGCGYHFGKTTTWSEPCIHHWEKDADKAKLDMNHPYFKALEQFTRMLLEQGKGKFIVGLTDFHPGGDHLAALRDPQELCIDMIDNLSEVKKKLKQSYPEYIQCYNHFYQMIKEYDMPASTWFPAIGRGKYYIPSNDFSCMISKEMFDDVFLQGIIDECKFLDQSFYHLDGPGALVHLDSILDIKELNAVQWVCGTSNEGYHRWVKVYQKIQAHKKGMVLYPSINELDMIFETLKPEGVWIMMSGINNQEEAEYVMKRIEKWR